MMNTYPDNKTGTEQCYVFDVWLHHSVLLIIIFWNYRLPETIDHPCVPINTVAKVTYKFPYHWLVSRRASGRVAEHEPESPLTHVRSMTRNGRSRSAHSTWYHVQEVNHALSLSKSIFCTLGHKALVSMSKASMIVKYCPIILYSWHMSR